MASCDMCGAEGKLFRTSVEGAEMMLCKQCSKYGKVMAPPKKVIKKESIKTGRSAKPEIIETIDPDYSRKIKKSREKLGLKQEDLAGKINEKESLIHRVESGKKEPSIALSRKLERFLGIKLVEQDSEEKTVAAGKEKGPVTIGDVIEIRKRKA
ncbi:MAG: multiprotein bridging factor aMBF1 [Candidatus Woesearchaeota archaeon]